MTVSTRTFSHALLVAIVSVATSALHAEEPPAWDGTWRFVPTQSTDLSPWRACTLTITVGDERVTIARQLNAGRRRFEESFTFATDGTETVAPSRTWADNRHIGAYMGDDRQRRIRAALLDSGRVLRVSTDLTLSTQQGERAVNILSNYQVSTDGRRLTVVELRSTRARPITSRFERVEE